MDNNPNNTIAPPIPDNNIAPISPLPIIETPVTQQVISTDINQPQTTPEVPKRNKALLFIVIILITISIGVSTIYVFSILNKKETVSKEETALNSVNIIDTPDIDIDTIDESIFKEPNSLLITTTPLTGKIMAGESIDLKIDIDEKVNTTFYLTSVTGSIDFEIVSPGGIVMNKNFAESNLEIVEYEAAKGGPEIPSYQVYEVKIADLGEWKIKLKSTDSVDYKLFAILNSGMGLQATFDKHTYQLGETVTIAARLINPRSITDSKIFADIESVGLPVKKIELFKNKNNIYVGTYKVTDTSGYITADINASGKQDGFKFSRNEIVLGNIDTKEAILTEVYKEEAVDSDNNGLFDSLDFTFEVNATKDTECAIQAELYSGLNIVGQRGDFFKLVKGKQFITLSFYGKNINKEMKNGPYDIKNVSITPIKTGIGSDQRDDVVLTTKPYQYSQFEVSN